MAIFVDALPYPHLRGLAYLAKQEGEQDRQETDAGEQTQHYSEQVLAALIVLGLAIVLVILVLLVLSVSAYYDVDINLDSDGDGLRYYYVDSLMK